MVRKTAFRGVVCLVCLSAMGGPFAAGAAAANVPAARRITVTVDRNVELTSIIFRLAGNPEYNQGRVPSYVQEVERHFGYWRAHAVVDLARKLRETQGMGLYSVAGMAVYMTDGLSDRDPTSAPPPGVLDPRWTPETAREFLGLARKFAADTQFQAFWDKHQPLYRLAVQRMQETLDKHGHLEWFDTFFGPRQSASFHIILGLLNGPGSYAATLEKLNGQDALYSVLGVWTIDAQGQPVFPTSVIPIVVHEFTHAYTNIVTHQGARELRRAGEKIFPLVADEMRRQQYSDWQAMMAESLDRACVLRYVLATDGPAAMQKAAAQEAARGFYWVGDLANLLGAYDTPPRKYADLGQFFPKIAAFFDDYATNADANLRAAKAKRK